MVQYKKIAISLTLLLVYFTYVHSYIEKSEKSDLYGQGDGMLESIKNMDKTNWRFAILTSFATDGTKYPDFIKQKIMDSISPNQYSYKFINDPLVYPVLLSVILVSKDYYVLNGVYEKIKNSSNVVESFRKSFDELDKLNKTINTDLEKIENLLNEAVNLNVQGEAKESSKNTIRFLISDVRTKTLEFRETLGLIQIQTSNEITTLNNIKKDLIPIGVFHSMFGLYHGVKFAATLSTSPHLLCTELLFRGILATIHFGTVGFTAYNYWLADQQIENLQQIFSESRKFEIILKEFDKLLKGKEQSYLNYFESALPDSMKKILYN